MADEQPRGDWNLIAELREASATYGFELVGQDGSTGHWPGVGRRLLVAAPLMLLVATPILYRLRAGTVSVGFTGWTLLVTLTAMGLFFSLWVPWSRSDLRQRSARISRGGRPRTLAVVKGSLVPLKHKNSQNEGGHGVVALQPDGIEFLYRQSVFGTRHVHVRWPDVERIKYHGDGGRGTEVVIEALGGDVSLRVSTTWEALGSSPGGPDTTSAQ